MVLIATFFLLELYGGIKSGSLSLLSDAGHMFTDILAILLVLIATFWSTKKGSDAHTYGYHRAEVLASLLNGALILFLAFEIVRSALGRWNNVQAIDTSVMLPIAVAGLIVNILAARMLHASTHHLGARSAYMHILGDLFSSVLVILTSIGISYSGIIRLDAIASILLAAILLWGGFQILKECTDILMEGVPKHISSKKVKEALLQVEQVAGIHDLHVWTIGSGIYAASAHIQVPPMNITQSEKIIENIETLMKKQFAITHTTFQIESYMEGQEPKTSSCDVH